MKVVPTLLWAAVAVMASATSARAELLPTRVDVRADTISFFPYTNASVLSADGAVVMRTGTRTIRCDALRWDLLKNRIVATGNVRVTGGKGELSGAVYARDLTTGQGYLTRLDAVPATFQVRDDEPASEKEMPAPEGTFSAVDLDGARPFMRSRHAIVTPDAAIRMSPVDFPTNAGPALRLPTYLFSLVSNPYIAQSAAPPASLDQPYSLFGSPNSLTVAHLRYDSYEGITAALDERLVNGNKSYLVTSILPLRDKQIDLAGFEQIRPGLQQSVSATHTVGLYPQNIFSYHLQESGKLLTQTVSFSDLDASNTAEFDLSTYQHNIPHFLGYQLRASYGYDHTYGGFPYSNDFRIGEDALVTTPTANLHGLHLGARYEYSIVSYDYPHESTAGTMTITADEQPTPFLHLLEQMMIEQNDDRYRDPAIERRALGLPYLDTPYFAPDGTPFPGYFAYAGLNTYRSYMIQGTIRGRGDNRILVTMDYDDDFPQYHGFGRPPLFASVDVVQRVTPALRIELGRSYSFGWNRQYLSPEYTFAISP